MLLEEGHISLLAADVFGSFSPNMDLFMIYISLSIIRNVKKCKTNKYIFSHLY